MKITLLTIFLLVLSINFISAGTEVKSDGSSWMSLAPSSEVISVATAEAIEYQEDNQKLCSVLDELTHKISDVPCPATYSFWTSNSEKESIIGWIPSDLTCGDKKPVSIYDDKGEILDDKENPIQLSCIEGGCNVDGKLKDCYMIDLSDKSAVNIDNFVSFMDESYKFSFEPVKYISYDSGTVSVDVKLKKYNAVDYVDAPLDVFIEDDMFGAIDTAAKEDSKYQYSFISNKPINQLMTGEYIVIDWKVNFYFFEVTSYTKLDVDDICSSENSDCLYVLSSDKKQLDIEFTSEYNQTTSQILIDPSLSTVLTTTSMLLQVDKVEPSYLGVRETASSLFWSFNEGPENGLVKDDGIYNNKGTLQ